MKRTKEWWARLTKEERTWLLQMERCKHCRHVRVADNPIYYIPKPRGCEEIRQHLIAKANGHEEEEEHE